MSGERHNNNILQFGTAEAFFFRAVVYGNIPNFKILEISKHITMIISYRREKVFFYFFIL